MKPAFTSSQEMYNYAANQLMNQGLSEQTVKNNLMERGVTDADAEIVIENMRIAIEKRRKTELNTVEAGANVAQHAFTNTKVESQGKKYEYGSFSTMQEMYNYAADQLIVKKLPQQTVFHNLINQGVSPAEAEEVMKNMIVQINNKKPAEVNTKRAEGKRMMVVGLILGVVGAFFYGTPFTIAGEIYQISYGILAIGAIFFFKGLFKMF